MDNNLLAELLFPQVTQTIEDLEQRFPKRDLDENAKVTRFAPSPTGFMHIGGLYATLISWFLAKQSGGVFMLRIEDTDKKREVENGIEQIISVLGRFGITFDEGATGVGTANGAYAPYQQSLRADIYAICGKELVKKGYAYPCFCSEDDLAALRSKQEQNKEDDLGYYGEYATCRKLTYEEIKAKLEQGEKFTLRLKSPGSKENSIKLKDSVRGIIEFPENIMDIVLLKSDGIPTYHFAHAVDDHFMRTTDVIRGEEWLPSYPIHHQLFQVLEFPLPRFLHISPIMKLDNGNRRKLSKRKDAEAAVSFYLEEGYPVDGVLEYLLTVANSDYEEWRMAHAAEDYHNFKLSVKKMSVSGALFDLVKLNDICKNVIAALSQEDVIAGIKAWAAEYNPEFAEYLEANDEYFRKTVAIWSGGGKKARKDIFKWSQVASEYDYLYQEQYNSKPFPCYQLPENFDIAEIKRVVNEYELRYSEPADSSAWFAGVKELAAEMGYCTDMKAYKADPTAYPGSVADFCTFLRIAITGRINSPDLFSIMQAIGEQNTKSRLKNFIVSH